MIWKMKKLLIQVISAILGLWLATLFIPGATIVLLENSNLFGFHLNAPWEIFLLCGSIIGVLNHFVKPVVNVIGFPLRIITFGLFSFVINIVFVWAVSYFFKELHIALWLPLIYTTFIIWGLNLMIRKIVIKKEL